MTSQRLEATVLYPIYVVEPGMLYVSKKLVGYATTKEAALAKLDENLNYFIDDEIFAVRYNDKYFGLTEIKDVL